MNILKVIVLGLALVPFSRVQANDASAAIAAGGIEFIKNEDVRMKSEVLNISPKKVTVRYEFVNDSKKAVDTVLAFPMPDITCGYWGMNKGIDDFTITVDGKSIRPAKELKAFNLVDPQNPSKKGRRELSREVSKAGLPLDCREVNKDPKLFAIARGAKLAEDFQGSDPENVLYTTRITYWWKQRFEPGRVYNVEHSYTPLAGGGVSGLGDRFRELGLKWDADIHERNEIEPASGFVYKTSDISTYSVVEYVMTTAQTWKGPIGRFTLLLKREKPNFRVGSTVGPLSKVDDLTLKFEAENFTPKKDLVVVFQMD